MLHFYQPIVALIISQYRLIIHFPKAQISGFPNIPINVLFSEKYFRYYGRFAAERNGK